MSKNPENPKKPENLSSKNQPTNTGSAKADPTAKPTAEKNDSAKAGTAGAATGSAAKGTNDPKAKDQKNVKQAASKDQKKTDSKAKAEKKPKQKMSKKKKIRWSIIAGILALLLLVGSFAFARYRAAQKADEKVYETVTLKKADPLTFKGEATASDTQDYYFDQSLGKISTINVKDGQKVDDKTTLLTYENTEVQSQADEQNESLNKLNVAVKNAEETLSAAQSKQTKAQQQLTSAQNEYNAQSESDDEGKAKKAQYKENVNQMQSQVDAADDAVLQARQGVDSANAELSSANQAVESLKSKVSSTVTSSTSGTAYINEKGKADPSVPVVQVVSSEINIEGTTSEYDFSRLKADEKVTIKPITSDEKIDGTITHVDQLPEKGTGSEATNTSGKNGASSISDYKFTVRPAKELQYGFNVQITLPLDEIRIPNAAVMSEDGGDYVYLYSDGKITKKKILAEKGDGYYILQSGLKEKDKVISNPDNSLTDGQELAVD